MPSLADRLAADVHTYFDIILPISGGNGLSQDDPIILDLDTRGLIPALEHACLYYLACFRRQPLQLMRIEFFNHEDRVLEYFEARFAPDEPIETYWFDITRPWSSEGAHVLVMGNPWLPTDKEKAD
jgi:hypothetical protein